ncbi:MAG TPA: acyltransferase [Casimicrobium sp.]|nr:acyltransferase [Casimicrobium sp.]
MSSTEVHARVFGLDTLRAAAILLVFMYHYQVFVSGEDTFGWLSTIGWVGVDLFFVLSGYLIGNQIFAELRRTETLSLKRFYARRFLRTLPNFYVVLALYFLFPVAMGGKTPPPLWQFLTFTQNIQLQPGTAFSHAWSLCIEEQFYVFLPMTVLLVVGALPTRNLETFAYMMWGLIAAAIVAAICWRAWLWTQYGLIEGDAIRGYHPNIYYASLCRADELLPGVAVALIKNFHVNAWQWLMERGRALFAVGVSCVAVMLCALFNLYEIPDYGYGFAMTAFGYSLLAMAFAVLLASALSPASPLNAWRVPGAAQLAAWSYALYLTHKAVAHMLRTPLKTYGIDPNTALGVVVVSIACLAAGWLLYRLVETPFMAIRARYFPVPAGTRAA